MRRAGEGITLLLLSDGSEARLDEAMAAAGDALFGGHERAWPLTKVLDIGGVPTMPSFGLAAERPGIPAHVHAGPVVDGRCRMCDGKLEAYFFPPLDCPPYCVAPGPVAPVTRLSLRPEVTKEQVGVRGSVMWCGAL